MQVYVRCEDAEGISCIKFGEYYEASIEMAFEKPFVKIGTVRWRISRFAFVDKGEFERATKKIEPKTEETIFFAPVLKDYEGDTMTLGKRRTVKSLFQEDEARFYDRKCLNHVGWVKEKHTIELI